MIGEHDRAITIGALIIEPDIHRRCGGHLVIVGHERDGGTLVQCDRCGRRGELADPIEKGTDR